MPFAPHFLLKSYSQLKLEMYTTLKWTADKDICPRVSWLICFPAEGGISPTRGQQLASVFFYMTVFFFVQAG